MNDNGIIVRSARPSIIREYLSIFLDDLGTYNIKGIDFTSNGKTIRVTNEDIWNALNVIFPGRQMD